ncbi:DUF397 domain-containing protein [Streptomyces zagrosensis]|uniref:DUF397 domain-containing protein n=1 Tax=Streptomyces zagrosensis TaxID=1042984 RepID=A0A7W9V1K1_9ACTN|nr:DUF397 domain-containing protein [Streptomyces zagrosensis]MBB5938326.1 hypothetical protein [Streptomyces zagrosensis]
MPTLNWQKSSYCQEANNCINLAATPDGTIHLRESEAPAVVIRTTVGPLGSFVRAIKAGELSALGARP